MSTHNICFRGEIKNNMWIPPLICSYAFVSWGECLGYSGASMPFCPVRPIDAQSGTNLDCTVASLRGLCG